MATNPQPLSTHNGITIRHANADDIPAVEALIAPFVESGDLLDRTYTELKTLLPSLFIAVRDDDGAVVGCAALEIYSRKLAEIRSLAVAHDVQGRGVGKRLVQACLDLAHEREVFEVMTITASEAFFKACGFDYTLPSLKRALFIQTRDKL